MSAQSLHSSGAWLMPFRLGMKISPDGQNDCIVCASCPAPDGITIEAEVLELSADLEDAAEAEGLRDRAAEAEHDAELSWDTAERRDQHIAGIEAGTEQPTVAAAWKQADVDNARHPREAVQGRKAKSPRARTKATAPGRQIERGR